MLRTGASQRPAQLSTRPPESDALGAEVGRIIIADCAALNLLIPSRQRLQMCGDRLTIFPLRMSVPFQSQLVSDPRN